MFVTVFHSYEVTFYLLNLSSANKKAIMNKNLCHLLFSLPLKFCLLGWPLKPSTTTGLEIFFCPGCSGSCNSIGFHGPQLDTVPPLSAVTVGLL